MARTEQEINAEKHAKPRPDLLPAAALETPAGSGVGDALHNLREFRRDVEPYRLRTALQQVAAELGGHAHACMAGGYVMGYGFRKHGDCTWRVAGTEQADPQTHIASAERHLLEYLIDPEAREEGSGFPVLWHAFSQICITIDLVERPPELMGENDGLGTVTSRCRPQPQEARLVRAGYVSGSSDIWDVPAPWRGCP